MIDLQKIPVCKTIVWVSSNSRLNTPSVSSPWRPIVRKIPSARYYSTSIALYESCKYLRPGRSGVFRKPRWSFPSVSGLQTCISSSSGTSIFATEIHQFFGLMTRTYVQRFRLPLSVVCSDFLICGCTKICLTSKKYRFVMRPCTFRAIRG